METTRSCTIQLPYLSTQRIGFLIFTGLLLIASAPAWSQDNEKAEPPAIAAEEEFDLETQLKSFDQVWKTVRQAHWDRDLVGENWDQAREKFRPLVESAKSIADVRKVLNELLDSLGQDYDEVLKHLDAENFADYVLLQFFGG